MTLEQKLVEKVFGNCQVQLVRPGALLSPKTPPVFSDLNVYKVKYMFFISITFINKHMKAQIFGSKNRKTTKKASNLAELFLKGSLCQEKHFKHILRGNR